MGRRGGKLGEILPKIQDVMRAESRLGGALERPTVVGEAGEALWIDFLRKHLPRRYSAAGAFVVGADGSLSRQIDVAIYDSFESPTLVAHEAGLWIPAESVYGVFEVKQEMDGAGLRDAAEKAASVRALRKAGAPAVLAGILAGRGWEAGFQENLVRVLNGLPEEERLDLGCALGAGAFEVRRRGKEVTVKTTRQEEALTFFFVRLVERLRKLGPAPAVDLRGYGCWGVGRGEPGDGG